MLTYGNWLWSALGSAVALGLDPAERWLCTLPLSHVGGLSILLRSAIYATTAVLHERFDADRGRRPSSRRAARRSCRSCPTTLARLLDAGLERPPALRAALVGGAPDRAGAARARAAARRAGRHDLRADRGLLAGHDRRPAAVLHARADRAPGGEILVARADGRAGRARGDGWLHTGDLGELDAAAPDVTGRAADTIVTGGENVAPAEVEAVLAAHPAVADVAVHGVADAEWGERSSQRSSCARGHRNSAASWRVTVAVRLARYKVPKVFRFSLELPRTQSGKLLRRDLEE